MKYRPLIGALAALASLMFVPNIASAVDNSISKLCDGAPEHASYARPGGYCELIARNQSLVPTGSGDVCAPWEVMDHHVCVCA